MAKKSTKIILIDADVVSHFIQGGEIYSLGSIFPNKIKILDKVYAELERFPNKKTEIDNLLIQRILELEKFPDDNHEIRKEYLWIKNKLFKGEGESACLAVARYNHNIIASSNLKDIKKYCELHKMEYITTMNFLCEALKNKLFDSARCDRFISKVISKGGKLPVKSMAEYNCD